MSDIQKDAGAPARVLETTLRKLVAAISGEIGDRNLIAAAVLACTEAEKLKAEATKAPRLNLTVNQMLQAIEFATGGFHPDTEDELETSMTFSIGPLKDDDGKVVADCMHCWLTDLAGEGAIPLDKYPTEQDLAKAQAPQQAQTGARDAVIYSYQHQPTDNVIAWQFGEACANAKPGGDLIDRGLSLLQQLQAKGYGITAIAAAKGHQQ